MIYNKKEFYGGAGLLVIFFAVLYFMFLPLFNGHNAMEYLDNLYNSISKGSVYYVPGLKEEVRAMDDQEIALTMTYPSMAEAKQAVDLLGQAGAKAEVSGREVTVMGQLSAILLSSLDDADAMYHNDGARLSARYSMDERRVMYNWWTTLKLIEAGLTKQKAFASAKVVSSVDKKGVEAAYNYYKVEPIDIMDQLGLVIFSLAFYVIYTLWYGFAILFLFEGWGLKLSH